MIVGLRHDLDTVYGLRWGLPKIISIEKKYDVKSTFFVRVDVIRSDNDKRALKRIANEGWEIGLHLINTINDTALLSPEGELKLLKKLLDVPIYGVTPCGSTVGFKGDVTWRIMCSLGLKYMEGYGMPDFKVDTFVFPTHLSLDIHYVRNFGEKEGYRKFKEDLLQQLSQNGIATVLVHPEGFVRSVQSSGLLKILLTLFRKGMMKSVYENFLCEFRDKVEFKRYDDICGVCDVTE
jgi:peptidoglycan/xylan/chitin deacetylase (PgdA/CDA1 family)